MPKVLHKKEYNVVVAETALPNSCGYLQQVSVVSPKSTWESKTKVQAESGFGSRQIFVGCFAGSVEFGPQRLADKMFLGLHLQFSINSIPLKANSKKLVRNRFTKLFGSTINS